MKIDSRLRELSFIRPVFHSEADFQHSLAWIIHEEFPNAGIRLEYPTRLLGAEENEAGHIDIWVEKKKIAIELKYKKDEFSGVIGGERYLLTHGVAHVGRYGYVKDVSRLEKLVEIGNVRKGYAIILTNIDRLWKKSRKPSSVSSRFCLTDGGILKGTMVWGSRERPPISLKGEYALRWNLYSEVEDQTFKYLVVRINQ